MTWQQFTDEYGATGAIRLGAWSLTPRPADMVECRARIAYADSVKSFEATATGPIGAMTSILYDLGVGIQILSLHQRSADGHVTTLLLCERDNRRCWCCGNGDNSDEASINALVAGANRLLAAS